MVIPNHPTTGMIIKETSRMVTVVIDGQTSIELEPYVLRLAPQVVPQPPPASSVDGSAGPSKPSREFATSPSPWLDMHVLAMSGVYKAFRGTVKEVRRNEDYKSGLAVTVALDVIGPSSGLHVFDFDNLRRQM